MIFNAKLTKITNSALNYLHIYIQKKDTPTREASVNNL